MSKTAFVEIKNKAESTKIQINRNSSRFWVDEGKALDSSLRELGSGIILKPELASKIKAALEKTKKA